MDGTLAGISRRVDAIPPLAYVDSCLRGVGQIVFMNNPLTGLLILAALYVVDPWLGTASVFALAVATTTAIMLGLDRTLIRTGLFGFNGTLIGAGFTIFLTPQWSWPVLGYIALAASATVPVTAAMGGYFIRQVGVPALTIPFNLVALTLFAMAPRVGMGHAGPLLEPTDTRTAVSPAMRPTPQVAEVGSVEGILNGTLRGIGQLFFADSLLAGLIILIAIALCSRIAAAVALAGSLVGVLTALAVGASGVAIYHGLYSYNSFVTAVAVAGVFFVPTIRAGLYAMAAAVWAAIATMSVEHVFSPWGLPALTVPFCLVTVAALMLKDSALPGLRPVDLARLTTPEQHRRQDRVTQM